MKYLLLLIVLGLVFFMLGVKRARPPQPRADADRADRADKAARPQDMLRCAQCGLHLPGDEALPGQGGVFCSAAHRSLYETEHGQTR